MSSFMKRASLSIIALRTDNHGTPDSNSNSNITVLCSNKVSVKEHISKLSFLHNQGDVEWKMRDISIVILNGTVDSALQIMVNVYKIRERSNKLAFSIPIVIDSTISDIVEGKDEFIVTISSGGKDFSFAFSIKEECRTWVDTLRLQLSSLQPPIGHDAEDPSNISLITDIPENPNSTLLDDISGIALSAENHVEPSVNLMSTSTNNYHAKSKHALASFPASTGLLTMEDLADNTNVATQLDEFSAFLVNTLDKSVVVSTVSENNLSKIAQYASPFTGRHEPQRRGRLVPSTNLQPLDSDTLSSTSVPESVNTHPMLIPSVATAVKLPEVLAKVPTSVPSVISVPPLPPVVNNAANVAASVDNGASHTEYIAMSMLAKQLEKKVLELNDSLITNTVRHDEIVLKLEAELAQCLKSKADLVVLSRQYLDDCNDKEVQLIDKEVSLVKLQEKYDQLQNSMDVFLIEQEMARDLNELSIIEDQDNEQVQANDSQVEAIQLSESTANVSNKANSSFSKSSKHRNLVPADVNALIAPENKLIRAQIFQIRELHVSNESLKQQLSQLECQLSELSMQNEDITETNVRLSDQSKQSMRKLREMELEHVVLIRKLNESKCSYESLQDRLNTEMEGDSAANEVQILQNVISKLKMDLIEKDKTHVAILEDVNNLNVAEVTQLRDKVNEMQNLLDKEYCSKMESIDSYKDDIARVNAELAQSKSECELSKQREIELTAELSELSQASIEASSQQIADKLSIQQCEACDALKAKVISLDNSLSDAYNELKEARIQVEKGKSISILHEDHENELLRNSNVQLDTLMTVKARLEADLLKSEQSCRKFEALWEQSNRDLISSQQSVANVQELFQSCNSVLHVTSLTSQELKEQNNLLVKQIESLKASTTAEESMEPTKAWTNEINICKDDLRKSAALVESLREDNTILANQMANKERELLKSSDEIIKLTKGCSELTNMLDLYKNDSTVLESKKQYESCLLKLEETCRKLDLAYVDVQQLQVANSSMALQIDGGKKEIDSLRSAVKALKDQNIAISDELDENKRELSTTVSNIRSQKEQLVLLTKKIEDERFETQNIRYRYEVLEKEYKRDREARTNERDEAANRVDGLLADVGNKNREIGKLNGLVESLETSNQSIQIRYANLEKLRNDLLADFELKLSDSQSSIKSMKAIEMASRNDLLQLMEDMKAQKLQYESTHAATVQELTDSFNKAQSTAGSWKAKSEKLKLSLSELTAVKSDLELNIQEITYSFDSFKEKSQAVELSLRNECESLQRANATSKEENAANVIRIEELETSVANEAVKYAALLSEYNTSASTCNESKLECERLRKACIANTEEINKHLDTVSVLESQITALELELGESNSNSNSLTENLNMANESLSKTEEQLRSMTLQLQQSQIECNEIKEQLVGTKEYYVKSVELMRIDYSNKLQESASIHKAIINELKDASEKQQSEYELRVDMQREELIKEHNGQLASSDIRFSELIEDRNALSFMIIQVQEAIACLQSEYRQITGVLSSAITVTEDYVMDAPLIQLQHLTKELSGISNTIQHLVTYCIEFLPTISLITKRIEMSNDFTEQISEMHSSLLRSEQSRIGDFQLKDILQTIKRVLDKFALLSYHQHVNDHTYDSFDPELPLGMETLVMSAASELNVLDNNNRNLHLENADLVSQIKALEKEKNFLNIKLKSKEEILNDVKEDKQAIIEVWSSKVKACKDANDLLSMQLIAENKRFAQILHEHSQSKSLLQELLLWLQKQPAIAEAVSGYIHANPSYNVYISNENTDSNVLSQPVTNHSVGSSWSSATEEYINNIQSNKSKWTALQL